jgi:hypothetical protein
LQDLSGELQVRLIVFLSPKDRFFDASIMDARFFGRGIQCFGPIQGGDWLDGLPPHLDLELWLMLTV